MGQGVDPVEITKAGLERAVEGGFDTVIVDTAGRQVVDDTLMTELKNIQVRAGAAVWRGLRRCGAAEEWDTTTTLWRSESCVVCATTTVCVCRVQEGRELLWPRHHNHC